MGSHRVLITGGAGFLGSHLTEGFRREGIGVRLFDLADCPHWAFEQGVECVQGDVRDSKALGAALKGVDSIVHAAFSSPRQAPESIHSVNVGGTQQTLAQALAHGVRRFILISSTIVERPPRTHPFLKRSPLARLDLYRSSRAEAERLATHYSRRGLSVAVVRPKTFIGPDRVSAFTIIFEWIRLGKRVPVLGGGQSRYQLLEIRDMAEGIRLLEGSSSEGVFFFGAHDFGTIHKDLQALCEHARSGARLVFIRAPIARAVLRGMELAGMVSASEWHSMSARGVDSIVDTSRAERELGWQPRYSNEQALENAYDWYVDSVERTGSARTTHPVPYSHLVLKSLFEILAR